MNYHDMVQLCPLSGIGYPPRMWAHCNTQCGWNDPDTLDCALLALLGKIENLPIEAANTYEAMKEAAIINS